MIAQTFPEDCNRITGTKYRILFERAFEEACVPVKIANHNRAKLSDMKVVRRFRIMTSKVSFEIICVLIFASTIFAFTPYPQSVFLPFNLK